MNDEEQMSPSGGRTGYKSDKQLIKELRGLLEAANADAAALFADMRCVEWDDEDPSAETKSMADHRARLELS